MGALGMKEALSLYKGKKVFVTGHTGFKGGWLTYILTELGAEVTGYSLPLSEDTTHFKQLGLVRKINHVEGDIRDLAHLTNAMQDCNPDIVFHLAAQALVRDSYADPVKTFSTNILGSVNILEAIRKTPSVRALVYITSDKCYENVEWIWGYRESDTLGGRDPYSASKASAELVFRAYLESYFTNNFLLGAASVRAGNVIGGGDWSADRIIPDCMRSIKNESVITLRNPSATRPWQHVLEPLSGYLLLGANLFIHPKEYSGAWNFGPQALKAHTVFDLVSFMVNYFKCGKIIIDSSETQHEAQLLQLNCDKAHRLLNWQSRWNTEQTFAATAYWYKSVFASENVESVTKKQIYSYFGELS